MEEGRATETGGPETPYRVKEIAALLGVAPKTIYEEIANGTLPALLIGGTYRVERPDFFEYKQHCRTRAVRVAAEPADAA